MLIQITTVDRSKRPEHELRELVQRLEARGHEVIVQRSTAAKSYDGHSRDISEIVDAIWESKRACFAYARQRSVPWTLILEDDCEIEALDGLEVAEAFVRAHLEHVDLFFLGASPNCWWTPTEDSRVVKYRHAYLAHAMIVTRAFIDRYDQPRTWTKANDIYLSDLIWAGALQAYGLRRQVAFQIDRRNRFAERVLYGFRWGDGRVVAGVAIGAGLLWFVAAKWRRLL